MLLHLTGIAMEITVIRRYRPYKAEMLEIVRAVTGLSILRVSHSLMRELVALRMQKTLQMLW